MKSLALVFACLVSACAAGPVATPVTSTPADPLAGVAWLAGRWVGEGLGGQVEETWAPPAGGQMVGHFRLVRAGKPVFYEIMLLDVSEGAPGGAPRMRVKHFHPSFVGWEEKDGWHAFEPVAVRDGEVEFQGLVVRRTSPTTAEFVVGISRQGVVTQERLVLTRAPL